MQVPKHNAFGDDGSCWSHLNVLAALTQDLWQDLCPAGAAAASQTGFFRASKMTLDSSSYI